jgi:PleD family two-component response regulator
MFGGVRCGFDAIITGELRAFRSAAQGKVEMPVYFAEGFRHVEPNFTLSVLANRTRRRERVYCVPSSIIELPQMTTKVLLVDDDEIVLEYLSRFIAAAGYDVVKATNGEAALASMQQEFAQIVILDIGMPGMDGLELCRAIRRQTYSGYVYIVLHTSRNTDKDILEGLSAGADEYLSKGTPKNQIIRRLNTAQRILFDKHTQRISPAQDP